MSAVRLAALAVIAVEMLAWGALAWDEFFRIDDFLFFSQLQTDGRWSKEWLDSLQFQHWAPMHRTAFSAMGHASTGTWHAIVVFEVALLGIGLLALYRSLELLFGRSWWLLVPLAAAGATMQFATPFAWPSNGMHGLPDFAAATVGLYGYLRYRHTGQRRWLALSVLVLAVGVLFYVRVLLAVVVIALVRVLFLDSRLDLRALWRERLAWGAYAGLVAVYGIHYVVRDLGGEIQTFTATELQQYVRILWLRNVPPRLLGGALGQGDLDAREIAVQVLAQALIIGAIAWTVWRKRSAWRGWAFIAVCFVGTVALMATGRLGELGPAIGYDFRYATHLPWLFGLGAMYAFHPRTTLELGAPWPRSEREPRPAPRRVLAGVMATAVVLTTALNFAEARDHFVRWPGEETRAWVTAAQTSLEKLDGGPGPRPVVTEAVAPEYVMGREWGPVQRGFVFAASDVPATVTNNAIPTAHVHTDGRAIPTAYVPRHRFDLARPAVRRALAPRGNWRRSGDGWCLRAGSAPAQLEVRAPSRVRGLETIVVADTTEAVPAPGLPVYPDSGFGYPTTVTRAIVTDKPSRSVTVTDQTELRGVRIDVPPRMRFCLRSLELGETRPS